MRKTLVLTYGLVSYALSLVCFVYAIGFLGNVLVPKSIDSPRTVPVLQAFLIDTGLLALFAIQHSVMARPTFKRWWTRYVPEPIERSTYVLFSSVCLFLLFWLWQPIGGQIWHATDLTARVILRTLYAAGWIVVLYITFVINHFDLFGLRQVWLYFRGREYTRLHFVTPAPYRIVRHPLYVGWLMTFWATPDMTAAHAFFALMCTAYILVAIQFEERNLADAFPEYETYRQKVPMLIPTRGGATPNAPAPRPVTTDADPA
jgi:protein-S-isoprenylcysteine O-methyltransferase Ste14